MIEIVHEYDATYIDRHGVKHCDTVRGASIIKAWEKLIWEKGTAITIIELKLKEKLREKVVK